MQDHWQSYLITGIVILLVLALRMRRVGQMRPLKLERLWVVPVIYLAAVAITLVETPPDTTGLWWCGAALVAGGAVGWWRGRLIAIHVDPVTHALNQTMSIATIVFLVVIIGVRIALREVLGGEARSWNISPATLLDAFMVFALGLLSMQRLEMYLRGSRLLAEARRTAS